MNLRCIIPVSAFEFEDHLGEEGRFGVRIRLLHEYHLIGSLARQLSATHNYSLWLVNKFTLRTVKY